MMIAVKELVLERGGRRVIDNLSFAVAAGEAVAVIGPNGAGKSTLLRSLAGLLHPAAGTIHVGATDGPAPELTHLVAHQNAVKLNDTVEANLAFMVRLLGGSTDAIALDAAVETGLAAVGLSALADTPAQFLSQGQRRRLALARLTAVARPLWLLDEPTVGLDARSREAVAAMISAHVAAGGTVLAATHDPLGLDNIRAIRLGTEGDET